MKCVNEPNKKWSVKKKILFFFMIMAAINVLLKVTYVDTRTPDEIAEVQRRSQRHRTMLAKSHTYMEKTAHNPKSIKFVGSSSSYHTTKDGYAYRATFRGTNAFGATVTNRKTFYFNKNLRLIRVE